MMSKIAEQVRGNEMKRTAYTENGAKMFKTSGTDLVDLNFKVASYRGKPDNEIVTDFMKAYAEDPTLAVKWLFYARDIRGGLGERRLFRVILKQLCNIDPRFMRNLCFVPDFGRWDDLVYLLASNKAEVRTNMFLGCERIALDAIKDQLSQDIEKCKAGIPVSLLAKWLPSENASSEETKRMARVMIDRLGFSKKRYRQTLSMLRKHIDVTEVKMSGNRWGEIDYEKVPSLCNLRNKNAFLRNDEVRRKEFLGKVTNGEAKINSSVNFPHDIVVQYSMLGYFHMKIAPDDTLEALWKALPYYGISNTLVVADGSASMTNKIPGSYAMAIEVANAFAIYCSERNSGEFKDRYITFSTNPGYVDFSKCNSLLEKLLLARSHCEVSDTDIEKVFMLILQTAVKNKMPQDEMVKNVLILSDMEFNEAGGRNANANLFKRISKKYADAGYRLPKLIFWNLCSRSNAIPLQENENGVVLVGGFSVHALKMVMGDKLEPFEILREVLESERYKHIYLG